MNRYVHALIVLVSLPIMLLGVAVADTKVSGANSVGAWAPSGRIHFEVLRGDGGLKLGEAEHTWQHDGRDYKMSLVLETTGLAAMLYNFRYEQLSRGRVADGRLEPALFSVDQQGKELESASFNWSAGEVVLDRRGRNRAHAVKPGDQDVLSVWHYFALLGDDAPPDALGVVTNRAATETAIAVGADERISTPFGEFQTKRVTLRARSGRLTIELWLSPAHGMLPLRVLMTDDKGEVLDQRALAIDIPQR